MTPKFSLVAIPVLAGLALVPAAWGNHQQGDASYRAESITTRVSPDAVDRALAAKLALQSTPIVSPDAVDRMKAYSASSTPITSPDVVDRAVAARANYGSNIVFDDRFNQPVSVPVATSTISSGRDLEWPQIGMGFGLGIVLALGLFLAMRFTRIHPLAH